MSTRNRHRIKLHIAVWAVGGVALTFAEAIVRLGHRGWRAVESGLTGPQWLALVVATMSLGYLEGYRALQRRFAPEVVARALELAARARLSHGLLAPLHAASLIGSDRAAVVRVWLGVAAIASAVAAVRVLPDPWRGIVDLAVAGALSWGLVALVARFADAVRLAATARPRDRAVANIQP